MRTTTYYFEDGYVATYSGKASASDLIMDKRQHGKVVRIVKR
jgi:hypothetical protein